MRRRRARKAGKPGRQGDTVHSISQEYSRPQKRRKEKGKVESYRTQMGASKALEREGRKGDAVHSIRLTYSWLKISQENNVEG